MYLLEHDRSYQLENWQWLVTYWRITAQVKTHYNPFGFFFVLNGQMHSIQGIIWAKLAIYCQYKPSREVDKL